MSARKRRSLITRLSTITLIIIASTSIPYLRSHIIDSLSWPLEFFSHISREIQGVILYHQNLVQSEPLKKEISLIRRQLHESEELYLENLRLRELLDFKEKSVYPLTAAGVIGYDPTNLSSMIIINKGKQEGLSSGLSVITNDGLVGRVVEVGAKTSKVLLINDMNSGVAAFVQRSRQQGLVTGTLAGGLILQYLPIDSDVRVSDWVVSSGLSGLYPKGIIIGKATNVQEEKGSGEIIAELEPSADLTKLEEVLVVLGE